MFTLFPISCLILYKNCVSIFETLRNSFKYHAEIMMFVAPYLKLNKFMQWVTGNIGYHHIHHLNVRIPFYRLPEAMEALPELQTPVVTTLGLSEMSNCFNSCLWDENAQRMVSYQEANKTE